MRWLGLGLVALVACGDPEPQYGEIRPTSEAPRAMLTGHSGGTRAALDLGAGCAGFVSADAPDHVIVLTQSMKLDLVARSERGPLALAVVSGDETLCDADEGTGHEPRVQIVTAGRYEVYVASLSSQDGLPYELTIGPGDKDEDDEPAGGRPGEIPLAVTVTSQPPGATVRTASGQVLGTTPAMFVWPVTTAQSTQPQSFVVELAGQAPTTVTGTPANGELALHATLAPPTPTSSAIRSTQPAQPIRDFQTAQLTAEVPSECQLASLDVEVNIRHSYMSDLVVSLQSPAGTSVTLQNHRGAGRRNLTRTYRSSERSSPLRPLMGSNARGTWTLIVRDTVEADIGSLEGFGLTLGCLPPGTATAPSGASGSTPGGAGRTTAATTRTGGAGTTAPIFGIAAPAGRPAITGNDVLDPWARP